MDSVSGKIGLKFWHSGSFSTRSNGELVYMGGKGKTKQVDPDELCLWDIVHMGTDCCGKSVEVVLCLIPRLSLTNGLRRISGDEDVREVIEIGRKYRNVELYVHHGDESPLLDPTYPPVVQTHYQLLPQEEESDECDSPKPKSQEKTNLKRGPPKGTLTIRPKEKAPTPSHLIDKVIPTLKKTVSCSPKVKFVSKSASLHPPTTSNPNLGLDNPLPSQSEYQTEPQVFEDYSWFDDRPDYPIPFNELVGGYTDSSEDKDPPYNPSTDKSKGVAIADEGRVFGDVYTDEDNNEESYDEVNPGDLAAEDLDVGLEQLDPEVEKEYEAAIFNETLETDSDVSDEEYNTARERVKACSTQLVQVASKVIHEVAHGKLGVQGPVTEGGNLSDYEDSEEEIDTPPESEDEGGVGLRKKRSALLVSLNTDFSQFQWKVGLRFAKKEDFREAVAKYVVLQGKNLTFVVGNKKRHQRLRVKFTKGCPFYVYASWHSRKPAMIVKRVSGEHTCQRNMKKNRQLKASWVAKQFLEVFKSRPHWPTKEIVKCIKRAFKVIVNRVFAYKVKYAAHNLLHGSMHEHYQKLGGYLASLKSSSPGITAELVTVQQKKGTPVFQRFFMCFEGLSKGWKDGCRKVLAVDASFLKTFLGDQLLCAVGRDANDQMFPVAWAIAEGENNLSWEWFFVHLQKVLELGEGDGVAVLFDEHQAIVNVVSSVLPKAEHKHCARHIFANWHKTYRGDELKLQFWKIAKCYNMPDYDEALEELTVMNPEAAQAFKAYNPSLFCRAFLSTTMKTGAITSNIAETFNGYIINARTKHLLFMLEEIRTCLMQRLLKKRQDMEKMAGVLCPRIQAKLDKEKHKATYCDVQPSTDMLFNVSHNMDQLVVNLHQKSCSCRKWEMLGIPCCHAVTCIFFLNKEAEDYVERCYTREAYLQAYAGSIPPLEGERFWPKLHCPMDPPPNKIGPGRPRKNRIRDPFENPKKPGFFTKSGVEMTCSLCKIKGHNKRRCPNKDTVPPPTEPPTKKPRGRPRRDAEPPKNPATELTISESAPHHSITAQPTQLGRGSRAIRGGLGSRGGGQSSATAASSSRRGRGQA